MLPRVPMLVGSTASYYVSGPPKPSWTYQFSITMAMIKSFTSNLDHLSMKQSQVMSRGNDKYFPIHAGADSSESNVPNSYRDKAAVYVDSLLKDQGIDSTLLGWDWAHDPRAEKPLKGEWTETKVKDEKFSEGRTVLYLHGGGYFLCSIRTHRWATWAMARTAGARVFSVDYRLAPDSPFPAALHDALAAYLYLLDPPADSGFAPVDPKNIVIMGDSAGGGLSFATMLAIRDSGLPMPAGVIGWSPWIDLLLSMPSVVENTATDYLPANGFTRGDEASLKNIAKVVKSAQGKSDEESILQKLPHLTGDAEMLRDESIVFAKKHINAPTSISLRVYDDMPHVFHLFGFLPSAKHAYWESSDFIRKVTLGGIGVPDTKSYQRISVQGWRRDLEEDAVPEWRERIGKVGGGPKYLAKL
ncbi:hypothetical protein BGZ80_010276 [Entomortierella chlamydospora]|uniref:Alpha/beta hydrolase fold-3 domain-containing protein n=1 Tax=Entomortierella chlamydospora TaxID=101097 RepID=A0A9P6N796_9FUNG|nr:hypothetical protein BGZ80_010276 [Entomortierella chlamydospora]